MALTYGFCLDDPSSMYNSAQFSDAFHSVVGDGITPDGSRFSVTINGFTATVARGYALASGRWLENDEPLALTIKPAGNNDNRTDALTVRVDHEARTAALEVLVDIDPDKLRNDLSLFRNEKEYSILLYLIRVPRGASTLTPESVTDMRTDKDFCGTVLPLSAISKNVMYIYEFLMSGIDQEVDRILAIAQKVIDRADTSIRALDSKIQDLGGGPGIGELQTVRLPPKSGWLLCDGSAVPDGYPELSAMVGGMLPDISQAEDRYRTYIYGGLSD